MKMSGYLAESGGVRTGMLKAGEDVKEHGDDMVAAGCDHRTEETWHNCLIRAVVDKRSTSLLCAVDDLRQYMGHGRLVKGLRLPEYRSRHGRSSTNE